MTKTEITTQTPKTQEEISTTTKKAPPAIQDPFHLEQMKIAEAKRTLIKSKSTNPIKKTKPLLLQNWRKQRAALIKTPVARKITQHAREKAKKIIAIKKSTRPVVIKPAPSNVSSQKIKFASKKQQQSLLPKKTTQRATQPAAQPVAQQKTKPATQPITQPVTQPETQPATQPEAQPEAQPETEPITPPVTQSTTDPETQPTTKPGPIEEPGDPEIGGL